MVGRSNEISRENCRAKDADDEPSNAAARDTARTMALARWRGIACRQGTNVAIPVPPDDATRQKSEFP